MKCPVASQRWKGHGVIVPDSPPHPTGGGRRRRNERVAVWSSLPAGAKPDNANNSGRDLKIPASRFKPISKNWGLRLRGTVCPSPVP